MDKPTQARATRTQYPRSSAVLRAIRFVTSEQLDDRSTRRAHVSTAGSQRKLGRPTSTLQVEIRLSDCRSLAALWAIESCLAHRFASKTLDKGELECERERHDSTWKQEVG